MNFKGIQAIIKGEVFSYIMLGLVGVLVFVLTHVVI